MKITRNEIWIKGQDRSLRDDIENTMQNLPRKYSGIYQVIYYAAETSEICKFSITKGLSLESVPLLEEKYGKENVVAREHEYEIPERPPVRRTKQTRKKQKPRDTNAKLLKQAINLLEEVNKKLDAMACQSVSPIDSEGLENNLEHNICGENITIKNPPTEIEGD